MTEGSPTGSILIVDDEPAIRFALTEALAADGHRVDAVASGEQALVHLRHQAYDLALLDLRLTGMGGVELLKLLRSQWPDTMAIVLTGYGTLETAVQALRGGAHNYLLKPCSAAEVRESVRSGLLKKRQDEAQREKLAQLERRLDDIRGILTEPPGAVLGGQTSGAALGDQPTGAALGGQTFGAALGDQPTGAVIGGQPPGAVLVDLPPGQRPGAVLGDQPPGAVLGDQTSGAVLVDLPQLATRLGGLVVDPVSQVITLHGRPLPLSPTEFDLVACMVAHAPRVLSPAELIGLIQGYVCEPHEARGIIRTHIYRIRLKIARVAGGSDPIRTVRGRGYTIAR